MFDVEKRDYKKLKGSKLSKLFLGDKTNSSLFNVNKYGQINRQIDRQKKRQI